MQFHRVMIISLNMGQSLLVPSETNGIGKKILQRCEILKIKKAEHINHLDQSVWGRPF